MAMIGSAAGRGAVIWVGRAGPACLAAAGNVPASAAAASSAMAAGARKRMNRAGIDRLAILFSRLKRNSPDDAQGSITNGAVYGSDCYGLLKARLVTRRATGWIRTDSHFAPGAAPPSSKAWVAEISPRWPGKPWPAAACIERWIASLTLAMTRDTNPLIPVPDPVGDKLQRESRSF